jgi:hypothetical protein
MAIAAFSFSVQDVIIYLLRISNRKVEEVEEGKRRKNHDVARSNTA